MLHGPTPAADPVVRDRLGTDAVWDVGGGALLGAALYCPYRTVLESNWSRRRVDEFDTAQEAIAEAEAQIWQRGKRGYRAV